MLVEGWATWYYGREMTGMAHYDTWAMSTLVLWCLLGWRPECLLGRYHFDDTISFVWSEALARWWRELRW
jgi:hypothetical protein